MKRYAVALAFSIILIGLYQLVDVRFFEVDLSRRTREKLFSYFKYPHVNDRILVLNLGRLEADEVIAHVNTLSQFKPAAVGINLCHYRGDAQKIVESLGDNKQIVFASCDRDNKYEPARIVEDHNVVTHFNTDRENYYELELTGFKGRGNDTEIINFSGPENYWNSELSDVASLGDATPGSIVLIDYLADDLREDHIYYENSRVTPLHPDYGDPNVQPDMHEVFITANIVATIINDDFIEEVGLYPRILLFLVVIFINVVFLSFVKTKWIVANIFIALVVFIILNALANALIVLAFDSDYYLVLDGLTTCLLFTSISTLVINAMEKNK